MWDYQHHKNEATAAGDQGAVLLSGGTGSFSQASASRLYHEVLKLNHITGSVPSSSGEWEELNFSSC